MMEEGCVDLLYLACNRLEFTRETFTTLLASTDWRYVHELFVYDDGSRDGTREWLAQAARQAPVRQRFMPTQFGSPVTAMGHFIEAARAPLLAKTDNDAMLPPGWLRQSLEVFDRHPELAFLGIEALYPHADDPQLARSYTPAQFISGLGVYRRAAFARSRPQAYRKWFGLEEWQMAQGRRLVRGWITPALPVFLLDRMPLPPWTTYSDSYIRRGWQRSWPKYDPSCTLWHWRWPVHTAATPAHTIYGGQGRRPLAPLQDRGVMPRNDHLTTTETVTFKVVILSARASNLVPCVRSVLSNEPTLPPDHIIVVDDGARREAEGQLPQVRWEQGSKPFVYARNANIGLRAAGMDVVLLNDDARLLTPRGFTLLSQRVQSQPHVGLCSAGIRGVVGNPRQLASRRQQYRREEKMLAFICVYIPKRVYDRIGPLDERFTGYGFEDNDYCARVRAAGFHLEISDGCVVEHGGALPSTFRTRPDVYALFRQNQQLFWKKWGRGA